MTTLDAAEHLRAARKALEAWPLTVADVRRVSVSENIAFRVADAHRRLYVLRLHRPEYHNHAELVSEQTWTAALLDAGVDVPVVVKAADGRGYVLVDVGDERRYAGLLEWVDGDTLAARISAGETDVRASYARLGGIMAALHEQASGWMAPPGFTRHAFDADGLMGEQPFWGRFWESPHLDGGQRRRLDALRHRIHAMLREYRSDADVFSLIHADLHAANVIVDGDRLHVIDFDDAGFGWHAYDFAVALYHHQDDADYPAIRDALIEGYEHVRPVADDTVAMIPLFLLIRSLASIGWTAARPELSRNADRTRWLMTRVDRDAANVVS
ncbi:MAG: phosphotransferase [Gammaproteobacteria bacterium]|nr:phosphotransferase [Gammaproteobacteria bacterium]